MNLSFRPVLQALLVLFLVIHVGAFGIWLSGDGEYGMVESIYFAIYTVATVGYAELPHLGQHGFARVLNAALIVSGIGAIAYFQSTLTAMLVQGVIGRVWRKGRMKNKIEGLRDHYVVAGCGRTGKYVVEELMAVDRRFVVIDKDEVLLERMSTELAGKLLYVVGDATEDHTMQEAGIAHASGVIAALSDDRDNLFVTLSARTMNPEARIVSKAVEIANEGKLLRAGADTTVSPNRIGGHRLVSELVRPKVTAFLDQMLRVTENLRFEEVTIPEGSPWVGKSLRSVPIRDRTNLLVVALHEPDGSYVYNPGPDLPLSAGTQLIVMGELESVQMLRAMVSS